MDEFEFKQVKAIVCAQRKYDNFTSLLYDLVNIDDVMPRHAILAIMIYANRAYGECPEDTNSEIAIALDAYEKYYRKFERRDGPRG